MKLTISGCSTLTPRLRPSLNDMLRDAIRTLHPPQRRAHGRQSLANQKVREGRVRAAGPLEDTLNDECDAGTDVEHALMVVGVIRRWVLIRWNKLFDATDMRTAVFNETRAQAACDPAQMKLLDNPTDGDIEALLPKLEWHRATIEALIVATEAELWKRSNTRLHKTRRIADLAGVA